MMAIVEWFKKALSAFAAMVENGPYQKVEVDADGKIYRSDFAIASVGLGKSLYHIDLGRTRTRTEVIESVQKVFSEHGLSVRLIPISGQGDFFSVAEDQRPMIAIATIRFIGSVVEFSVPLTCTYSGGDLAAFDEIACEIAGRKLKIE